MAAKQSFEENLEACINALLREEYPFTPTSMINAVAGSMARRGAGGIIFRKMQCKEGVRAIDFLELPAEIRNRIYEFAVMARTYGGNIDLDARRYLKHPALQPGITKVDKQLRRETLPLFYANNHFVIDISPWLSDETSDRATLVPAWVAALGPNAQLVKNVTIKYEKMDVLMERRSVQQAMSKANLDVFAGIARFVEM